jgi:hypothetical protein
MRPVPPGKFRGRRAQAARDDHPGYSVRRNEPAALGGQGETGGPLPLTIVQQRLQARDDIIGQVGPDQPDISGVTGHGACATISPATSGPHLGGNALTASTGGR